MNDPSHTLTHKCTRLDSKPEQDRDHQNLHISFAAIRETSHYFICLKTALVHSSISLFLSVSSSSRHCVRMQSAVKRSCHWFITQCHGSFLNRALTGFPHTLYTTSRCRPAAAAGLFPSAPLTCNPTILPPQLLRGVQALRFVSAPSTTLDANLSHGVVVMREPAGHVVALHTHVQTLAEEKGKLQWRWKTPIGKKIAKCVLQNQVIWWTSFRTGTDRGD